MDRAWYAGNRQRLRLTRLAIFCLSFVALAQLLGTTWGIKFIHDVAPEWFHATRDVPLLSQLEKHPRLSASFAISIISAGLAFRAKAIFERWFSGFDDELLIPIRRPHAALDEDILLAWEVGDLPPTHPRRQAWDSLFEWARREAIEPRHLGFHKPTVRRFDFALLSFLARKDVERRKERVVKTPEPTAIEFQATFQKILAAIVQPGRRFVFIVDNLDRLSSDASAQPGSNQITSTSPPRGAVSLTLTCLHFSGPAGRPGARWPCSQSRLSGIDSQPTSFATPSGCISASR
jgi:hypothetical protein